MTWFWLNVPLMTVAFLAMTLIPLWMVLRRPDTAPEAATAAPAQDVTRQLRPALASAEATTGWGQAAREPADIAA